MKICLASVTIVFAFTLPAMTTPLIHLNPETPIEFAKLDCDHSIDASATHISRAAEAKSHAFKLAMETFGLVVISHDNKLAARAITPVRIGNGAIGFSLETFAHNEPFIGASEFTIYLPTLDSAQSMLNLIANAAEKKIPYLDSQEERLIAHSAYVAIHATRAKVMDMSSNEQPLPGDELRRVFIMGHIQSWQNQERAQPYLGYTGGRIIPLQPERSTGR